MFKFLRTIYRASVADEAYQSGDYARSYVEAEKALAIDPNSPDGLFARARAGLFRDPPNWPQIHDDVERAISLKHEDDDLFGVAARAAYEVKDFALCLERSAQTIAIDPLHACGHHYHALALFHLMRYREAVPHFDRALENDFSPHQLHWRGHTKTFTGDIEGAVEDFTGALEHLPDNVYILKSRAAMLGVLGRNDEAFADYARLATLPEALPDALAACGNLRWETGDQAGARRDFREFLSHQASTLRTWQSPQRVCLPLLHAINDLFDPGHVDNMGAVLLTFDRRLLKAPDALLALAGRIKACRRDSRDPIERETAAVAAHDNAELYRRKPLPLQFTGGSEAWVADIHIFRCLLPERRLMPEGVLLDCAAEPAPDGRLAMIPGADLAWK
jgi:tetratricopeptide (TPR) repeat protein